MVTGMHDTEVVLNPPEVFVERDAELAQLGAWSLPARAGSLVLVAGDAGVGKAAGAGSNFVAVQGLTLWTRPHQ